MFGLNKMTGASGVSGRFKLFSDEDLEAPSESKIVFPAGYSQTGGECLAKSFVIEGVLNNVELRVASPDGLIYVGPRAHLVNCSLRARHVLIEGHVEEGSLIFVDDDTDGRLELAPGARVSGIARLSGSVQQHIAKQVLALALRVEVAVGGAANE